MADDEVRIAVAVRVGQCRIGVLEGADTGGVEHRGGECRRLWRAHVLVEIGVAARSGQKEIYVAVAIEVAHGRAGEASDQADAERVDRKGAERGGRRRSDVFSEVQGGVLVAQEEIQIAVGVDVREGEVVFTPRRKNAERTDDGLGKVRRQRRADVLVVVDLVVRVGAGVRAAVLVVGAATRLADEEVEVAVAVEVGEGGGRGERGRIEPEGVDLSEPRSDRRSVSFRHGASGVGLREGRERGGHAGHRGGCESGATDAVRKKQALQGGVTFRKKGSPPSPFKPHFCVAASGYTRWALHIAPTASSANSACGIHAAASGGTSPT